jgi:hypothetical protein
MRCPFFEEVVVAFCRAYPVKKMVPSDRLNAACICTDQEYDRCALFQEVMARVRAAEVDATPPGEKTGGSPQDPQGR